MHGLPCWPITIPKTCPHDLAGVRCLLLESIGLYSKNLQDHYYRKISILIAHYRDKYGVHVEAIPDETKRKEWLKNEVLWHDWKGIAKALEK